jgi:competence protein ComEA
VKGFSNSLTIFASLFFASVLVTSACTSATTVSPAPRVIASVQSVNINTASPEVLQTLPGIGPELATKIMEHRERYGPFRKPEHLLIVDGISEKRFSEFKERITTD